jgi:hypothetical protein
VVHPALHLDRPARGHARGVLVAQDPDVGEQGGLGEAGRCLHVKVAHHVDGDVRCRRPSRGVGARATTAGVQ